MTMQVIPIHLKNDVQPADDLVDLLLSSSKSTFENGDVLVVSQKIISKHEGQVVKLESIIPSELSISNFFMSPGRQSAYFISTSLSIFFCT